MIGNDIIDRHFAGVPLAQHVRHLDRICTPEEAFIVRTAIDPCLCLATMWGCKESAYKLFVKRFPYCHFVPREFVVHTSDFLGRSPRGEFLVTRGNHRANVEVTFTDRWLHAVATWPENKHARTTRWIVREIADSADDDDAALRESRAVRALATELLAEMNELEVSLQFTGRIPTLRRGNGSESEMDISLSHDGNFAAAAISSLPSPSDYEHPAIHLMPGPNSEGNCSTFTV